MHSKMFISSDVYTIKEHSENITGGGGGGFQFFLVKSVCPLLGKITDYYTWSVELVRAIQIDTS